MSFATSAEWHICCSMFTTCIAFFKPVWTRIPNSLSAHIQNGNMTISFFSHSPKVWPLKWIINAQFPFHVSQKHLNICRSPSPLNYTSAPQRETKKQLHQCDDQYTWGCCHSGSNNNPCHVGYWKHIESLTCGYAPVDVVVILAVIITRVMWAIENILNHWCGYAPGDIVVIQAE